MSLEKYEQKYKIHKETRTYFQSRCEAGVKSYDQLTVEEAREGNIRNAKQYGGEIEFHGSVKEFTVPSLQVPDGIPITVYRSKNCDSVSAPSVFVYFHGGGNCVGTRQTVDSICRIFSRDAPCVVVNVEYRLAPEFKWPANHDDAKCVVRWVKMNRGLIGGDNESVIGVGGDSAGGRLAAMVCHELDGIDYQVLVYPNVDFRHEFPSAKEFDEVPGLTKAMSNCVDLRREYQSAVEFGDFPGLSTAMVEWFLEKYIDKSDIEEPRASPLLQKDFTKLPPALIILAEMDMLKDEGIAYNEKLKAAGVQSQVFTVKGVAHGFFHLPGHFTECCSRAHEKVAKFIKSNSHKVKDL